MNDTLIKVDGLSKKFCRSLKHSLWYGMQDLGKELVGRRHGGNSQLRQDEFWAVKDVSFELKRGECLGLVGRNGAGKTTLLRLLNGLIKPDQGRIEIRGHVGALIALGAGFNPILTGRENVYVNASILGLSKTEIDSKVDEIIDFSEIREFIDSPVQNYSSGMLVRLGFSVASTLSPDVLILDEVLAVGDAAFRNKCFARIGQTLKSAAVVFVSHNETQVQRICDKAIFLEKGEPLYYGDTMKALREYKKDFDRSHSFEESGEWILSEAIDCVEAKLDKDNIDCGSELVIRLQVFSGSELNLSKAYLQFFRESDGSSCAYTESVWSGSDQISICSGENTLIIKVKPLYLVEGKYAVSLALFSENGKATVAHSRNIGVVNLRGPLGIGPSVCIPSYWRKES